MTTEHTRTADSDLLTNMAQALEDTANLINALPTGEIVTMLRMTPGNMQVSPNEVAGLMRFQSTAMRKLASDRKAGKNRTKAKGHPTDG